MQARLRRGKTQLSVCLVTEKTGRSSVRLADTIFGTLFLFSVFSSFGNGYRLAYPYGRPSLTTG